MSTLEYISLYSMAAIYIIAGFNHFINPRFYLAIMPKVLPAHKFLNQLSGIAEIVLGVGLLFYPTRLYSSYLIILMLILFMIVHIDHLIHPPKMAKDKMWFLYFRAGFQFVLIYWAWIVGKY